jgi:restriction endonuclease Mrr
MPVPPPIRILAPVQEGGDLFGRLVADLFLALGYDEPRLNIHKAGREIDVLAKHRLQSRWVVAECKATAKPIGGDDINKFAGSLQAERRKLGQSAEVAGYFLSLSGFTETALEQERDIGQPPRLTLLDGRRSGLRNR